MPFPRNRAGLREHTVENPSEADEGQQGDDGRAPAFHQEPGHNQISDQPKDDRAGANVDRIAASDQPGAQPAEEPDRREREGRIVVPVPEQQREQDEKRQRVREQMACAGVEQRTEHDSNQPRNRSRHDAKYCEGRVLFVVKDQIEQFDQKKDGNQQRAPLHRFLEGLEMRSGHGSIPQKLPFAGVRFSFCRLYSPLVRC